jgi:hypothetical protein
MYRNWSNLATSKSSASKAAQIIRPGKALCVQFDRIRYKAAKFDEIFDSGAVGEGF